MPSSTRAVYRSASRRRCRTQSGGALSGLLRVLALLLASVAIVMLGAPPPDPVESLAIRPGERLLVVAPHPDDETLGAAGLIHRVLGQHGRVDVVLITAGDGYVPGVTMEVGLSPAPPRAFIDYGIRRVGEARHALGRLGASPAALRVLGFPDGSLTALLGAYWERPLRSRTTGALDPPYPFAVDPAAPYDGRSLREQLIDVFDAVHPTMIVLPDPLDHHPDHRATAVFTILALDQWLADRGPRDDAPRMLAYLIHWPAWPPDWDAPTATAPPTSALQLPPTLPDRALHRETLTLTGDEQALKRTALAAHVTQRHAMETFLDAFVRRTEPFTVLDRHAIRQIAADHAPAVAPPAARPNRLAASHSTVTLLARLRG